MISFLILHFLNMRRKKIKLLKLFGLFNLLACNSLSCNSDFSIESPENIIYKSGISHKIEKSKSSESLKKRNWAILVYIAADNDLHYFAWNNIKQLASGANENTYIIVQLNEPGKNKKTQRYLVEKNKAILLNKDNQQKLDSGDPQTLIDFCTWTIQNFPAENYMLDLSNHGSGVIDRNAARLINPAELFILNPSNLMLELDRSIEFLKFLENPVRQTEPRSREDQKGVCFDETFQSYFTNQKLEYALNAICNEASKTLGINNFKFAICGMDACLMQMLEVAELIKKYAGILVASQEVELGPGWRYDKILKPLQTGPINAKDFAKHIVKSYEETYSGITNDFTLSAINLDVVDKLESNVHSVASILIEMLQNQKNSNIKHTIKACKTTVAFEEPSYIDIGSFYLNLLKALGNFEFKDTQSNNLRDSLKIALEQGLKVMEEVILANVMGNNISYAKGLSIYFPEKRIHNSYHKTNFAQSNQWVNFLLHYIA